DRCRRGACGLRVLPGVRMAANATGRSRLYGVLAPGASVDAESKMNLESAEIVFPEQTTAVMSGNGSIPPDRSYRLQFGGQHNISEDSSVEVTGFLDTISGHPVGLMAT